MEVQGDLILEENNHGTLPRRKISVSSSKAKKKSTRISKSKSSSKAFRTSELSKGCIIVRFKIGKSITEISNASVTKILGDLTISDKSQECKKMDSVIMQDDHL